MVLFKFMRPRKRDFRGDTRKGAKNYGIVSSDDSEVYRRKDPFAGWNRKRPSVQVGATKKTYKTKHDKTIWLRTRVL